MKDLYLYAPTITRWLKEERGEDYAPEYIDNVFPQSYIDENWMIQSAGISVALRNGRIISLHHSMEELHA